MVYIFLGNGFEEIEALSVCDILRRGGVDVKLAGVGGLKITGGHGITVTADIQVSEIKYDRAEMLIIPGGVSGVESIERSTECSEIIKNAAQKGIPLAAICAGPRVLAKLSLLKGKKITCYPGMEKEMTGAIADTTKATVSDGSLITGRAAGAALDFAFMLLEALKGQAVAEKIRLGIYYER
jgi:4-methyl-5(b-hydroxyethyl)-thiazole monophosphate biosynthesis